MVHALATQRRVRRNRHRWRKTASGRQHYNYFRDYDPATGRYVQSDPIGLNGGLSTYAYAGGAPFGFSDPLGLAYGDGQWQVGDVFFGPAAWLGEQYGFDASLNEEFVNAAAGLGDGVSSASTFGIYSTSDFRAANGIDGGVARCSAYYRSGDFIGENLAPAGRFAYMAKLARLGRNGDRSLGYALQVSQERNAAKAYFRGPISGLFSDYKSSAQVLAKYGPNPDAILTASRASNPYVNSLAATATYASSLRAGMDSMECGCAGAN